MANLPNLATSVRPKAGLPSGTFRFSAVELLVSLVLLMLVTPFVEELSRGDSIEAALLTLVMVSAVLAVGSRGRKLVFALLLVIPALAAKWINHVRPELISPFVPLVATMVFFVYVVALLLRFILHASRVDANVLCAGISGYLLLGLLWVPAYLLATRLSPTAFALTAGPETGRVLVGFDAFYFSFITLSTVGYGDIIPVSKLARTLAVLEVVTGTFYMAILIARLVSMYASPAASAEAKDSGHD